MRAKVSPAGLRFFAHDPGAECELAHGETPTHLALKAALAQAAISAGWVAEIEAGGDGWRADVLATGPDGRRVALEAQVASRAEAGRTARYAQEDIGVLWVLTGAGRGGEPAITVTPPRSAEPSGGWLVTKGCSRYRVPPPPYDRALGGRRWWLPAPHLPLPEVVGGYLNGALVPHRIPNRPGRPALTPTLAHRGDIETERSDARSCAGGA
jgi:competence protein CoiA